MEPINDKEVDFHKYCELCKFMAKDESDDPCNDCLNSPCNENSHRPVEFVSKEKASRRR